MNQAFQYIVPLNYSDIIFCVLIISLILGIIITYLISDNIKHREMQARLKESHDQLFQAYEALTMSEEELKYMAHHDYLTGLPSRMMFMEKLQAEMDKKIPLVIMLIDIDNFKVINDTLGHIYGDKVLKEVGERLLQFKCFQLFVSRFGGDEFLMFMPDNDDQVTQCIQMLLTKFEAPIIVDDQENYVRVSIGITRFPIDSSDIDQLIINADTAMYKVKHGGKNGYMFYSREMKEENRKKAEIDAILKKAMREDDFYLLYQPQICFATGEVAGFEALLRIRGKEHIPISQFIRVAEESDLIASIGRKVTEMVICQMAKWRDQGYYDKTISLNLSSRQVRDKGYINFLSQSLQRYRVNPESLEIEITESILLDEDESTLNFILALKEMGLNIVLDDFGTGYSSINYLTYIPVKKIKMDKSLIDKFLCMHNYQVIQSIIALAHSLDLAITAEGIENSKQFGLLKENGCDFVQGFLFSKPLTTEEIPEIYYKNYLYAANS